MNYSRNDPECSTPAASAPKATPEHSGDRMLIILDAFPGNKVVSEKQPVTSARQGQLALEYRFYGSGRHGNPERGRERSRPA